LLAEYSKFSSELHAPEFFELADAVHAATCLQSNAVLISNDKHFDKIRDMRIIEVWKISEAIEKLLNA
jgi:predicted nucleic acid-binding protein